MKIRFYKVAILVGVLVAAAVVFYFRGRRTSLEGPADSSVTSPAEPETARTATPSEGGRTSVPRESAVSPRGEAEEAGESRESAPVAFHSHDAEPGENEIAEGRAEAVVLADGREWRPPDVNAATLGAFREAFVRWRNSSRDETSTANLRLALEGMSKEAVLAVAATLMRLGTEQDRLDALWAGSSGFGVTSGEEAEVNVDISEDGVEASLDGGGWTAGGGSQDLATEDKEESERAAEETHDVVLLVAAGLEDPSPEVRQMAYETVSTLSQERADVLYSQLLCSDSPVSADLRLQLMEELDGADDDGAVTLFVQAMQSPDEETAVAARENLERIAGQEFASLGEALEWLEAREQALQEQDEEPWEDPQFENMPDNMTEREKET
ncbi:MAG: hypothetical protein J6Y19_10480 [Kiritimatiellae bacterium]|nr:hypothetical protein [Kiritimatiellia bacterium]